LKLLGIPTRKIQAGLGHATESVTERYLSDLEGSDLREIYEIKYLGEAKQF
jgi:DNA-binding protein Fis